MSTSEDRLLSDPVWASELDADEFKRLDPGTPPELNRYPDVLIVGGGAIGLATGVACSRAGLGRVLVLDRAPLASGATGRSAGILAPEPHVWTDPPALVTLARESLRLTRSLDKEWNGGLGLLELDCLIAGQRPEDAPVAIEAPTETLQGVALREREPELVGIDEAIVIHDQARVNPLRFCLGLAEHADTVATSVDIGEPRVVGRRLTVLPTSLGEIHPGAVVFATGTAPRSVSVPHGFVKGHLIATEPVDFRLRSQIATPLGGAFQLEDGRLVSGGTLDVGDDSPLIRSEVVDAIRRGMDRVLPRAAAVPLAHAWCGFRPTTPDRLPIIDHVPGLENAWFTSGHYRTGILMAAATGAAISSWIRSGSRPENVAAFNVARFG